ncbi:MAG: zinc ABC transporter substrate-binding protein [Nitrospirae bacterium]|nr:zinc ABC transporter substrate-binding protein [Nitrospirota bacterium]MBF0590945.1 zinc ABC transporter substrate-binding protein [Nitrospirota bacterium]
MKEILICLALIFAFSSYADARLNVVATLPWIGSITRQIGQDRVEVTTLVRANQDPHYLEPKPSMILAARKADLLIYNGLDLEIGYLPVIIESSRNPNIQSGKPGNLDCSGYVSAIGKVAATDRSMGDVHPLGNPHYHFSPRNIIRVAEGITDTLSRLDPADEAFYMANLASLRKQFDERQRQWSMVPLKGKKVVAYHALYDYLASDFGFTIIGYVEDKPGIAPSSRGVEQLIEVIKRAKPDKIITSVFYPKNEVQFISDKTGVPWVELPADVENGQDWFSFMDKVVSLLK